MGARCSSTGSPATARCNGHVVGNLLIVVAVGAARRPRRPPWTGSAGCWAPRGTVLPMARHADGHHRRGARHRPGATRRALTHGARTGRGGHHRRAGSSRCVKTRPGSTPRPAPKRSTPSSTADWVVLGPGSWYTSVIPHLWSPRSARRLSRPGRAWSSSSTSRGGRGDPGLRPRGPPGGPPRARTRPAPPHGAGRPRDRRGRRHAGAGGGVVGGPARGRRRGSGDGSPRTTRPGWRRFRADLRPHRPLGPHGRAGPNNP